MSWVGVEKIFVQHVVADNGWDIYQEANVNPQAEEEHTWWGTKIKR
jgi:hypothetical protein